MNFSELKQGIHTISSSFRQNAVLAINAHLTIRNWMIGCYIFEFEQNGEDRARYGTKLLQNLADEFNEDGLSYRNLKLYRQFYNCYPQIATYVPLFYQKYFGVIGQSLTAQSQIKSHSPVELVQAQSAQMKNNPLTKKLLPADKLIHSLSFTHLSLLLPIDNPLKRLFYEIECIKGTWSVRELKRQINSLYFERSGISQKPDLLSTFVRDNSETDHMLNTIKSPFTFDFLGLKAKDVVYESDLEQALIEHLEEFIMELGHGFCFEARQKRMVIGDEYYFCDLVFYHRILKCHVLIELKIGEFSHEHIGQLKTYINYYRKEMMRVDDNPPVGILLVTNKNTALVEYATADGDKDIFVSKYLLELPTKEQLKMFIEREYEKI